MDERFKEILLNAIEKAGGYIDKGIDLAINEAPLIINELLRWNMAYHSIIFAIGIGIIIYTTYITTRMYNHAEAYYDDDVKVGSWVLWTFGNGVGLFVCIYHTLKFLKIWIAPRIWLIEYATNLIKNGS